MLKDYDSGDRILLKLSICLAVIFGTIIVAGVFALVLFILHLMGIVT